MAEDKRWTHGRKQLLISTRLRHQPDFFDRIKKRSTIWETILREIKEVDNSFPFSRDDICRAFLNVQGTYKRIKKRHKTSGEAATNWEFFEEMDEVFGNPSYIEVEDEAVEYWLLDKRKKNYHLSDSAWPLKQEMVETAKALVQDVPKKTPVELQAKDCHVENIKIVATTTIRVDNFCKTMSDLLRQIKLDSTFNKVQLKVLSLVTNAVEQEKMMLYRQKKRKKMKKKTSTPILPID